MDKLIVGLLLSAILVACENIERPKTNVDNAAIRPSFTAENFSEFEAPALLSLCQSFSSLVLDASVQHEFDYKKEVCSELSESYRQGQKVDLNGLYPIYVANNRSLFHFPEVRFDRQEQGHVLASYCSNVVEGNTSRLLDTGTGFGYTMEVIVNHSEKEFVQNTPGCYDNTMLAANSSSALVCLRLWKDQKNSSGVAIQQLSYESITFVVSSALRAYSGYAVYRKKYDYLQCTDKTKALVYEATRIK